MSFSSTGSCPLFQKVWANLQNSWTISLWIHLILQTIVVCHRNDFLNQRSFWEIIFRIIKWLCRTNFFHFTLFNFEKSLESFQPLSFRKPRFINSPFTICINFNSSAYFPNFKLSKINLAFLNFKRIKWFPNFPKNNKTVPMQLEPINFIFGIVQNCKSDIFDWVQLLAGKIDKNLLQFFLPFRMFFTENLFRIFIHLQTKLYNFHKCWNINEKFRENLQIVCNNSHNNLFILILIQILTITKHNLKQFLFSLKISLFNHQLNNPRIGNIKYFLPLFHSAQEKYIQLEKLTYFKHEDIIQHESDKLVDAGVWNCSVVLQNEYKKISSVFQT